jgi:PII-like signaling protein
MTEVTVFLDEDDQHEGKPLHEYIMRYLMHHNILGASMFTALMGYGHKHHLHRPNKLGTLDEAPIMILFIDEEEKVRTVIPHLKEVVKEGLIVQKSVERL